MQLLLRQIIRITPILIISMMVSFCCSVATASEPALMSHSPNGLPIGPTGPSQANWPAAFAYSVQHPGTKPIGVNDFSCKPRKGTYPVILIPGTSEDAYATYSYLAPKLKKEQLCLYTFNYNPTMINGKAVEWSPFTGDIKQSAQFLGTFVDKVLGATGANKVDLIGHSQGGGPLPRAYLKWYGGRYKVHSLIALGPSNFGTPFLGSYLLADFVGIRQVIHDQLNHFSAGAFSQQLTEAPFLKELNSGQLVYPEVKYTIIASIYEDPSEYIFINRSGVKNILIQKNYPLLVVDHYNEPYSPEIAHTIIQALGA